MSCLTEDDYVLVTSLQAINSARVILSDALPLPPQVGETSEVSSVLRILRTWQHRLEGLVTERMEAEGEDET